MDDEHERIKNRNSAVYESVDINIGWPPWIFTLGTLFCKTFYILWHIWEKADFHFILFYFILFCFIFS